VHHLQEGVHCFINTKYPDSFSKIYNKKMTFRVEVVHALHPSPGPTIEWG